MKCEGMPTQRCEEKRVEKCTSVQRREREREIAQACLGEKERESALAPPFKCFFLPLGVPYSNWA